MNNLFPFRLSCLDEELSRFGKYLEMMRMKKNDDDGEIGEKKKFFHYWLDALDFLT